MSCHYTLVCQYVYVWPSGTRYVNASVLVITRVGIAKVL